MNNMPAPRKTLRESDTQGDVKGGSDPSERKKTQRRRLRLKQSPEEARKRERGVCRRERARITKGRKQEKASLIGHVHNRLLPPPTCFRQGPDKGVKSPRPRRRNEESSIEPRWEH